MTRPDWWPDWVPAKCSKGHELKPGTVRISPLFECAHSEPHHTWMCATCYEKFWPPGCRPAPEQPQRIIL